MQTECNYDKTKLLHQLSAMSHFISKHAIPDAQKDEHPLCASEYGELKADLDKHILKLQAAVVGLSKEDKYK